MRTHKIVFVYHIRSPERETGSITALVFLLTIFEFPLRLDCLKEIVEQNIPNCVFYNVITSKETINWCLYMSKYN